MVTVLILTTILFLYFGGGSKYLHDRSQQRHQEKMMKLQIELAKAQNPGHSEHIIQP